MAVNIFEQYGIKEVANVQFEALENELNGTVKKGDIVLFLDTLKTSTIEQTAENTEAKGGWGNPSLIMWDYGKEINLTLTDALISMESLRLMMGGAIKEAGTDDKKVTVRHTALVNIVTANTLPDSFENDYGTPVESAAKYENGEVKAVAKPTEYKYINLTTGTRGQVTPAKGSEGEADYVAAQTLTAAAGDQIRIFWDEEREGGKGKAGAVEIVISPNTFPGTYKVYGDTFIRNTNGKDSPFQFVIHKAKVNSSVTLTLEAEGDPSTFEMTLRVLRASKDKGMMSLIKYE